MSAESENAVPIGASDEAAEAAEASASAAASDAATTDDVNIEVEAEMEPRGRTVRESYSDEDIRIISEQQEADDLPVRKWLFFAICCLEMLANFDSGVIPATIPHIMRVFDMTYVEVGLLGSLTYIGLVMSCPLTGYILTNVDSQRTIIVVATIINTVAVFCFALSPIKVVLAITRFFIGFSQAPIIIYAPVWVDEFAPEEYMTIWLSLLQANVSLGIMFGYICGGVLSTITPDNGWKISLLIQGALLSFYIPLWLLIKGRYVNAVGGKSARVEAMQKKVREGKVDDNTLKTLSEQAGLTSASQKDFELKPEAMQPLEAIGEAEEGDEDGNAAADEDTNAEGDAETNAEGDAETNAEGDAETNAEGDAEANAEGSGANDEGAATAAAEEEEGEKQEGETEKQEEEEESALGRLRGSTSATSVSELSTDGEAATGTASLDLLKDHVEVYDEEEDPVDLAELGMLEQISMLFESKLFILCTLGLTGLYFVVTGIQFWITDYLIKDPDIMADPMAVTIGFAITALTGPVGGVFFGGWLCDRQGGYKDNTGEATYTTLRTCMAFGFGAVAFAVPAGLIVNFPVIIVTVWLVLFFGGALVPAATGVCMNAVSNELRAFANSISMLFYNLFGYALAPYLCGQVAEALTNSGSQYGIRWGFRIVMLFSVVATVPMFAACYVAYNNWQDNLAKGITNDKAGKSLEDGDGDEDDVSFTVDQSTAQSSAPGQLESKTVDSSDEAKPAPYVDGRRQGRRAKRRASTFVQTMGNISLHVSRGRTLTSFHDTDLGHHIAESVVSAFTGASSADEENNSRTESQDSVTSNLSEVSLRSAQASFRRAHKASVAGLRARPSISGSIYEDAMEELDERAEFEAAMAFAGESTL